MMETSSTKLTNADEEPAAEPALAQAIKKSKKKKKPKKLTPKQKALEKLEKAAETLLLDPVKINKLLQTISAWLKQNDKTVYKLLNQQCIYRLEYEYHKKNQEMPESEEEEDDDEMTINSTNIISFDDFKIVLADMRIPCTHLELHALCKLLDPDETGTIEYKYFTAHRMDSHLAHKEIDGMRFISKSEKISKTGICNVKKIDFKTPLAKNFASKYPLYFKIDLRLLAFASDKEYKYHIRSLIVYTHMKVYDLVDIIKERTDIASTKITVFRDYTLESAMDENATLESFGFVGGEYNEVAKSHSKTILFYDYDVLPKKDPILNCDFYFHNYKYTPATKTDASKSNRNKH